MSSSTGITQQVSSIVKFNWFLISAAILLVCCSCINSKAIDVDQLSEHQMIESLYPSFLSEEDSNFVERAAPRLGRASPRLGRASPRLGRRAVALLLSRLNHAGRYYNTDDDATNDFQYEIESSAQEKRAAPRLGRSINLNEQKKHA